MQKISISEARNLSTRILTKFGFRLVEIECIVENLIDAELAGKSVRGISTLLLIQQVLKNKFDESVSYFDYIDVDKNVDLEIVSESENHLYVDAHYKTGFYAISKALDLALNKINKTSVVTVGIKNLGFNSGFIGSYAHRAVKKGFIYLGFHSSSGGLNYYGSIEDPLGTNPITIAFPSQDFPLIIDTSMAEINWKDIETARRNKTPLTSGKAVDKLGNDTTDPDEVFAVKSIAGHKGTALSYGVELLAGALTGSRVGFSQKGGWGSFFILINPAVFIGTKEVNDAVSKSNKSIKNLKPKQGSEVFVPGERSYENRIKNLKNTEILISEDTYKLLVDILN